MPSSNSAEHHPQPVNMLDQQPETPVGQIDGKEITASR
jgi:hypothetical protein